MFLNINQMANEKKKPTGTPPNGWWFMKYYVDDKGNVFEKGTYNSELTPDSPEVSAYLKEQEVGKEEVKKEKGTTRSTESEFEPKPSGVKTTDGTELSDHTLKVIQAMQAMNEKRAAEQQESFLRGVEIIASTLKQEKSASGGITSDDLAQAIAKAEQYRKGGHYYDDIKDVDPEDVDENGAVFTSYGNSYFIVDDTKPNGRAVRTPYGRVFKFKFQGNRITRVGRDQSYSSFCAFRTKSKKEIEWLRQHSLYGVDFYEDTNLALSANAVKAHLTSGIIRQLSMMDQPDLIKRAKAEGIPVGGDLRIIRAELAIKLADEKWRMEQNKQTTTALGSYEELLMQ